jgi:hypothetical protein
VFDARNGLLLTKSGVPANWRLSDECSIGFQDSLDAWKAFRRKDQASGRAHLGDRMLGSERIRVPPFMRALGELASGRCRCSESLIAASRG